MNQSIYHIYNRINELNKVLGLLGEQTYNNIPEIKPNEKYSINIEKYINQLEYMENKVKILTKYNYPIFY